LTTAPLVPPAVAERDQFEHLGLLYRDSDEYVAGTTTFVLSALAADDPVLVAVPGGNLDLIRDGLGIAGRRVRFADMSVAGRNPGRIIPGVLLAFADEHRGQRVSIIGEPIWPGRTVIEYPACAAHEAIINVAFTGRNAAILCPYDVTGLEAEAVADAEHTHPVMLDGPLRRPSAVYGDPLDAAALFNRPFPDPPPDATAMSFQGFDELAAVRRFVVQQAVAAGMPEPRVADLTIAVNEVAANTSEHGGGSGLLSVWTEAGTLVCQVTDSGHLHDALAGRIPPTPDQHRGRGLYLVNQLCDLVRVYSRPSGTAIRLHMALG
jgi:anti-sigma regulatory factor (Ser/Thr protein kinase)